MTPIEQAREAQRSMNDAIDRFERAAFARVQNLPRGRAERAKALDRRRVEYDTARAALAALARPSLSTPVDGVGAEPRVKPLEWVGGEARSALGDLYEVASLGGSVWQVRWNGTAFTGWHSSQIDARAAAQADYERRILSALASPEAEARLRERVANEKPRNIGMIAHVDHGKTSLTAAIMRTVIEREAAEARLAQAERGPAVTEAIKSVDYICGRWEKNQGASSLTIAVRALLAALTEPQSLPETAERRVKVPTGQTPLNDKLHHPLLDAFQKGVEARVSGERSPYHGHSLEHCLHAAGWVQRDLRLALDEARAALHPQSAAGEEGK